MTPQAHYTSLTSRLAYFSRYKNAAGLNAYLDSLTCWERLVALKDAPSYRQRALRAVAEATSICQAAVEQATPLPEPGSKRVRWDATMIARFRAAYAKAKSDEGAARLCGITPNAARNARLRYIRSVCQGSSVAGKSSIGSPPLT